MRGFEFYSEQYGWKDMSYEDIYDACPRTVFFMPFLVLPADIGRPLYYNADMAKKSWDLI